MSVQSIIRLVAGIAAVAALGGALWYATRPPPLIVQGEVSGDQVDISSRVSGRVLALHVDVGDRVAQGDLLLELENPQLAAAHAASLAALAVSKANLLSVETVRPESVAAQKALVAADQADVDLYQEVYDRQSHLVVQGNTPQATLDQAVRNLEAAHRKREADEAQLALVEQGASKEQRALAAAQVDQVAAQVGQQQTDLAELRIVAPISGEVTTRIAETGENFSAGAPLYALIDIDNVWFTFNLREDLLAGLKVGDEFIVDVPAIRASGLAVRVTLINVQGQYATWRATRATGDFDLRTFEVRARPVAPVEGLRPGMSVIARWHDRAG